MEIQPSLTDKEHEIIREMATGKTDKEIGATLHVTEATVKVHLQSIYRKLGVRNRVQAAILYVRNTMENGQFIPGTPFAKTGRFAPPSLREKEEIDRVHACILDVLRRQFRFAGLSDKFKADLRGILEAHIRFVPDQEVTWLVPDAETPAVFPSFGFPFQFLRINNYDDVSTSESADRSSEK